MSAKRILLVLAATTVGITAGVMFCYQIAVMPGIGRLPDREFIAAFQSIDDEIVNPIFVGLTFLGGAVFLVAATVAHRGEPLRFRLLAVASVVYIVGVVVVTMAGNVPKNDTLADFPVASSTVREAAAARESFEDSWNRLHVVRTLASITSLAVLSVALVSGARTNTRTEESAP
ncbi:MAG TPA: anthrone oxygenase family protein [Acidimicrobiales bacterium]|nr:anthrone oxygenase family protein [Acidimicrobiales bacterium]